MPTAAPHRRPPRPSPALRCAFGFAAAVLAATGPALAAGRAEAHDHAQSVARAAPPAGPDSVGLGLAAGQPAMLPAALGQGLTLSATPLRIADAGSTRLAAGAELLWLRAVEHSPSWQVTQDELRVRLVVDGELERGRGRWLLRLGLGATTVWESRLRHQSERLVDGGIHSSGLALVPGAELQVGVALRIVGHVGVRLRVGPSVHLGEAATGVGALGTLEAAWLP